MKHLALAKTCDLRQLHEERMTLDVTGHYQRAELLTLRVSRGGRLKG